MNKNPIIYHNSDSLSQGKSMRYLANWDPHREYFNDNCIQDFVTCDGILWGCMENCKGHRPSEGCVYWSKAVVGPKGAKGKEIISIYEFDSTYDDDYSYSTIKVVYSDGTDDTLVLKNYRDKGEKGDKGDKGDAFTYEDFTEEQLKKLTGPAGRDGINGTNGRDGKDGENGKDGRDGTKGADGIDGKTYVPSVDNKGVISWTPTTTPSSSVNITSDLDNIFVSHEELNALIDLDVNDKFDSDVKVVGVNYGSVTEGSTIPKGTTVKELLIRMLTREEDVTATKPAAAISTSIKSVYEYGTHITGTLSINYTDGYFSRTGYKENAKCTQGTTTFSGTGVSSNGAVDLNITTSTTWTATVPYSASTFIPSKNTGVNSTVNIPAGTLTTTKTVTPYRSFFYGCLSTVKDINSLTSSDIRNLTNSNKAADTAAFNVPITAGAKQVIIAVTGKTLKSVLDTGAMNLDLINNFTLKKINVEGANGSTAVEYNVYSYTPDDPLKGGYNYSVTFK